MRRLRIPEECANYIWKQDDDDTFSVIVAFRQITDDDIDMYIQCANTCTVCFGPWPQAAWTK